MEWSVSAKVQAYHAFQIERGGKANAIREHTRTSYEQQHMYSGANHVREYQPQLCNNFPTFRRVHIFFFN